VPRPQPAFFVFGKSAPHRDRLPFPPTLWLFIRPPRLGGRSLRADRGRSAMVASLGIPDQVVVRLDFILQRGLGGGLAGFLLRILSYACVSPRWGCLPLMSAFRAAFHRR